MNYLWLDFHLFPSNLFWNNICNYNICIFVECMGTCTLGNVTQQNWSIGITMRWTITNVLYLNFNFDGFSFMLIFFHTNIINSPHWKLEWVRRFLLWWSGLLSIMSVYQHWWILQSEHLPGNKAKWIFLFQILL
jgi:hypothetical protein